MSADADKTETAPLGEEDLRAALEAIAARDDCLGSLPEAYRKIVDEALSKSPRAPEGEKAAVPEVLVGNGYVYHNEDTSWEYSKQHPIDSGEVPDATDIRCSTLFEDALVSQAAEARVSVPPLDSAVRFALNKVREANLEHQAAVLEEAIVARDKLLAAPQGASVSPRVAEGHKVMPRTLENETVIKATEQLLKRSPVVDVVAGLVFYDALFSAAPSSPVSRLIAGETEACRQLIASITWKDDPSAHEFDAARKIGFGLALELADDKLYARIPAAERERQEAERAVIEAAKVWHKPANAHDHLAAAKSLSVAVARLCKSEDRPTQEVGDV